MADPDNIHDLVFEGHAPEVGRLLIENPDLVHLRNKDGDTPLHFACWAKQVGLLGTLLAHNPDVNARGCYQRTPLHYAVHEGRTISVPIVHALLQYGADPDLRDDAGFTPADWAKIEMEDGLAAVLEMLDGASRQKRIRR
jgi:ankyrin repeat protein